MNSLTTTFQQKFVEFAADLKGACPEYIAAIDLALALSPEDRLKQFRSTVLPGCAPSRDPAACPGCVLPGVTLAPAVWQQLSENSKTAIQQYLTIMSFCCLYDSASKDGIDISGAFPWESFSGDWNENLKNIDLEGFAAKFKEFAKSSTFSKLPEKFMKGQLAKLCEELVKEFKPEDFGLSAEELKKYESEPHKIFELITEIYTKKPEVLQKAIQKISKRFQEKFQTGQLRPEQIVAEAEEMMKEFSENTAFVELMESFRGMFNFSDMETARKAGREGSARLSLVKERLKKKLDAKKGTASPASPAPSSPAPASPAPASPAPASPAPANPATKPPKNSKK